MKKQIFALMILVNNCWGAQKNVPQYYKTSISRQNFTKYHYYLPNGPEINEIIITELPNSTKITFKDKQGIAFIRECSLKKKEEVMIIALQIPANNDREAYQNALDDALPDNF